LGWRWRLAAAVGVVLVSTAIMGLAVSRGESANGPRLRIMTYNVKDYITLRQPDGIAAIAAEISLHDPDLVALQDARELDPEAIDRATVQALFGGRQLYSFGQYVIASRLPL